MWQRVQTLFLLLLGALMIITVFMEFWQEQRGNEIATLDAFRLEHVRQGSRSKLKAGFLHRRLIHYSRTHCLFFHQ